MKKEIALALVLIAVIVLIMTALAVSQFSSRPVAQESGAFCPVTMSGVIVSAKGDVYNTEDYGDDYEEPAFDYLVTYSVQGDAIVEPALNDEISGDLKDEQENSALQNEAWQIFTEMIPPQNREMIGQYSVFTDGADNTLAAVEQLSDDITLWSLQIDTADLEDKDALLFTLIHEYAHVLTLDSSQVTPDQELVDDWNNPKLLKEKAAACPTYFTGTGCSHADSYIHVFYNRFWLDVNDEWQTIDAMQYDNPDDLTPYYDALYQFYKAHPDQFIDDYSTTHPAEDIAESFAYFVFGPKPTGTSIKEQKIAFFYEYPELVALRQSVLNSACQIEP